MENIKQEKTISEKDIQEISIEEIKNSLKDIVGLQIAVWRKNIDDHLVIVPLKKLEQYIGDKDAEIYKFYIEKNWKERIKNRDLQPSKADTTARTDTPRMEDVEKYGRIDEQVSFFRNMPEVEREEILDECISKLSEDRGSGTLDLESIIKMVEVLSNTFYANNANLEHNTPIKDTNGNISGVLVKTNWIVQILINLFDNKKYPYNNLKLIDDISTGSKTMDHINKVFLRFVSFCVFFNEYIDKGLFTKNIRAAFKDRYQRNYTKKAPNFSETIEKIFKDGIRRIEKGKELQDYALGALLFDIGKIRYIKYHDSSEPYDEEIIKKHALHGYNMIIKAKGYPFEVLAMSVFHHEYYGGHGSYNFSKPVLSKIVGKKIVDENTSYFISYDKDDFINGISLSYFPCKIIEILDVYDALITKKSIPIVEALGIMKKEFITKSLKIDPIIFRIFLDYNARCGVISMDEVERIDSVIF